MNRRAIIRPNKLNKEGKTNIKIRITHKSMVRDIATEFYIRPSEWDSKNLKVNDKHNNYEFINFELNKIILDYEKKLIGADIATWHVSRVLEFLKDKGVENTNVFDYFSTITEQKTEQSINNGRLFAVTLKKLREFHAYSSLSFDEINYQFVKRFEQWLTKQGCAINTRSIELRNLRTIINHAIDDEITTNYPFRKFKIKSKMESDTEPLSIEQIRKIRDFKTDSTSIQIARDMFMISFYLIGINISDLYALKHPKKGRIIYIRNKTKKKYSILVTPELQELIDKYGDKTRLFNFYLKYKDTRNFTIAANKHLKKIGEEIGEPKLITYHARHTWATLAAGLDIPKETISQGMGHSIKTVTDIYIKFDMRKIDEANRKVIDCLS